MVRGPLGPGAVLRHGRAAEVARVGARLDYPVVCLLLGLQMAAAPRRARADMCVTEALRPRRSLIAG